MELFKLIVSGLIGAYIGVYIGFNCTYYLVKDAQMLINDMRSSVHDNIGWDN